VLGRHVLDRQGLEGARVQVHGHVLVVAEQQHVGVQPRRDAQRSKVGSARSCRAGRIVGPAAVTTAPRCRERRAKGMDVG